MTNEVDDLNSPENFDLELFFELSPDLLCIAGYDGYFKKINPSVSRVLGYSEAELFARPINEFIYADDRHITTRHRENLVISIPLLNFENRYLAKDGSIVWLSWTSIPVESKRLVYAIAKNITHKKQQEQERNLLLSNLTKINTDLKQFGYTTSHDLRSPVNNLLLVFDLLDRSKISDKETLEFIDILKTTTTDIKHTLNNYIEVLTQKDKLNIKLEELSLDKSLIRVKRSISSLLLDSKATFKIDFSEFNTIKFNDAFLDSIFLNLITNSIKYASPDRLPSISIYSRKTNGIKQLIFADNGLGFDMDKVMNKIFGLNQMFHNHKDSKGIGLYLVYNHITSLGGSITVDSRINEGATFTLSFKN